MLETSEWRTSRALSGLSALSLFRISMGNVYLMGLIGVSFGALQVATNVGFSQPLPIALFLFLLLELCFAPLSVYLLRKRVDEEVAAGYTTLYGDFRDVPQIDRRTGIVIRQPGRDVLGLDERERQKRRVIRIRKSVSR